MNYPAASSGVSKPAKPKPDLLRSKLRGIKPGEIKTAFSVEQGEKLCIVISLGYGKTQGVAHKSKSFDQVAKADGQMPEWFKKGVKAALLAPTAMNQQKFQFALHGNQVSVKPGMGFYTKIDLGIVKYHFEIGADNPDLQWGNPD